MVREAIPWLEPSMQVIYSKIEKLDKDNQDGNYRKDVIPNLVWTEKYLKRIIIRRNVFCIYI